MEFPIELIAFEVKQPLGTFYLTKFPANLLRELTFSIPLRTDFTDPEMLDYVGGQRAKKESKLKEIGRFIDTVECAFPNNIILAANYNDKGEHITDENRSWRVEKKGDCIKIIIPSAEKLASIVDGQHRVDGFLFANNSTRAYEIELPVSIYLDLPLPYQAYLFATINHNQQPVNKSLSYILYGYNLDDEEPEAWSTEKLAVYLSRKLNSDKESVFYRKIKVAPQIDSLLIDKTEGWAVSTATIVDGILALVTKNSKRDRDEIGKVSVKYGRNRKLLSTIEDNSVLRKYYIDQQDIVIYKAVDNFFKAVVDVFFWEESNSHSLMKTIGIQALFDVLKENLNFQVQEIKINSNKNLELGFEYFRNLLSIFSKVNFNDTFFPLASAAGRSRMKNFFLYGLKYKLEFDSNGKRTLKSEDVQEFENRLK
jgi:DNA phosphorothioation-associated DGQHR protein 1